MNRKLFGILLVGVFVLQSCEYLANALKYRRSLLQFYPLAIVETDVEKVRSKVLEVFEDNGMELELYFSDNALFSHGHRIHVERYRYQASEFEVFVSVKYDISPPFFPEVRIAVYPARFGSKEYDSINNRFEAIVDGLVESGLFQLQSSFFNEDYLDPQSATDP